MAIISVAERNDVSSVDIAGNLGVGAAGISRAGRSFAGIGTWFQGTYGAILLNANGSYTYRLDTLDPDTNVLGAGQTGEERFTYTYVENGVIKTGSLVVQVSGVDEADQQVTNSASVIYYTTDTVVAANHRIVSTAQYAFNVEGTASDVTQLTNNGSILVGSAAASEALGFGMGNTYVATTNNGRIEAVVGQQGMGATGGNHMGTFLNNGVIRAFSSAIQSDGAPYLWRAVGLGVAGPLVNAGTIEAVSLHGEAFGIWTGTIGTHIVNSGTIFASGARYEVTGIRNGQSWQYRIENSGTIHAVSTDPNLKSVGISLFRDSTNAHMYGTVVNSGTIVADVAIRAYAGYLTGIHVTNSGHIEGALDFDWGLNIVTNLAGGDWVGELVFGLHQDVLVNAGAVVGNVTLGAMTDLFDGRGGSVSGLVDGGAGMDILIGGNGADRLSGGSDIDRIVGGGGADQLAGGEGGDIFAYSGWADSTAAAPDFISDFQSGVDKIDFGRLGPVTLTFTPDGAATLVQATGQGGTLIVRVSGPAGAGDVITEAPLPGQVGSESPDILAAGTGDAQLNGRGGADVLLGGAGNDQLDGWTGADTMFGGAGDDGYWIDEDGDRAIELDGQGIDYVYTSADFSLQAFIENIFLMGTQSIGALGNMLDNVITGNPGDNSLSGLDGDDVIIGGGGADTMMGNEGADRFVYQDASDSTANAYDVIGTFESGIDKIDLTALSPTSITWVEFSNYWSGSYWNTVTIETPTGTMTIRVLSQVTLADFLTGGGTLGTAGDDNLTALTGPAELYGFGGNDTLTGSGADDLLDGGTGADRMRGLGGNDLYLVDHAGDVVTELAGEGDDEVRSALSDYILADHVERLTLVGSGAVNGTGNGLANRIEGTPHSNRIDGGAGSDTMVGGDGSDIYIVSEADDRIIELFDQGQDWVYTALAAYTLPDHVETVTGTAATGQVLTGNSGPNALFGGAGDDQLWGGAQVDVLNGGAGNDRLDGGASEDSLTGGTGDDLYFVDGGSFLPSDNVYENVGEGSDEVRTALAAYTLAANVETLTGISATGQTLTGNGLANAISGGAGHDLLDGGAGADQLAGGLGDDVYIIDSSDTVIEAANAGTDEVRTALAAYTLGANLENLTGTSATGQTLTGNGFANRLSGGAGNDTLNGGAGADQLAGGLGNDVYVVDAGDTVTEAANAGTDEIRTALSAYALAANLENLTGTSATGQALTGNALANRLAGGAGNDTLDGAAGADQLAGGLGNDLYRVDAGDSVIEASGAGTDEVRTALAAYTLTANVENLTGTSATGQSLTGNGLVNAITGGVGNDVINGGAGADQLNGGLGNDIYVVDAGDIVVEAASAGTDEVRTGLASYALSANIENLTGTSASGQTLTGNGLANLLTGGAGNDILSGGMGADQLRGGLGNDTATYADAASAVTVSLALTTPQNTGGGGTDTLIDVENLLGSAYADTLTGNGLANVLDGRGGADRMTGGAGHDVYYVDHAGDVVVENFDGGTDELRTGLASYSIASLLDIEILTAASDIAHDFRGNSRNNVIIGGGGADVLRLYDGGSDIVNAGAGDDSIFFIGTLTAADRVNGGDGVDTLILQGPYGSLSLTSNIILIENISILGGGNTAFGDPGTNLYDYVITTHDLNFAAGVQARINGAALLEGEDFTFNGSAETDASFVVYGGKGKDTLTGGLGNDIFFYAEERFASGDTVDGGSGYDGMFLRGNYVIDFTAPGYTGLFTSIENLTLTSATDERYARGGGTEFDYNLILSNAIVKPGETLTVSGTILMATETMILDGSQESDGLLRLFGGKAGDTLKGGGQADLIHGNLGADILAGGGGADTFRYDMTAESNSLSMDQILDFTPGTDKLDLSRIDARTNLAGDQAFIWIGSNAFSGNTAQLRAFEQGGVWILQGDVNGDRIADFTVA
ncbi:MAG: M10 family metallopeptidase C-terminal domain-containing protein, partial [Allosphingosinicella sp.]